MSLEITPNQPPGNYATLSGSEVLTNKRITKRTSSITTNANPTFNTDNADILIITAQAGDITSMSTNLSGTPNTGDKIEVWITGTASRTIGWGASFVDTTITRPTSTNGTATLRSFYEWNGSAWAIIGWC